MIKVCFVCTGNICRSPTAEAVFLHLVKEADLESDIEVDSAGTGNWHAGERADARSREAASRRGYELTSRARAVRDHDFEEYDYLVAMDRSHASFLESRAQTEEEKSKIVLLRRFDTKNPQDDDVPDPYYGGEGGFEEVLDLCESGCRGLLEEIREHYGL